jgi:CheY-like chemotaxis protein
MDIEKLTKLTEALASLVQALGWPLLVLLALIYFGAPLKKFLRDVSEFTFRAGASGLEATAKRQQIEAAAMLGAASTKPGPSATDKPVPDEEKAREIASVVNQTVKPGLVRRLGEASILWVDDIPSNNVYERRALEALGIRFTLSTYTEDALEKIRLNRYDVIISDMGRPSDRRAGYTLLEEKQKLGDKAPFIIYSTSNRPEHKTEARRRGAFGNTSDPQELFQLVLSAIQVTED